MEPSAPQTLTKGYLDSIETPGLSYLHTLHSHGSKGPCDP